MKNLTGKLHNVDCLPFMRSLPPKSIGAIVTDPPWWGDNVGLAGQEDAIGLFRYAAAEFVRLTDHIIIILGVDTDPWPLSYLVGAEFYRVVTLDYVPPGYKGTLLADKDIAYVYGASYRRGNRPIPGRFLHVANGSRRSNVHPCPRPYAHMRGLVSAYTKPGETILDPFAGIGTTLLACEAFGRKWIGCEVEAKYCAEFERRRPRALANPALFDTDEVDRFDSKAVVP